MKIYFDADEGKTSHILIDLTKAQAQDLDEVLQEYIHATKGTKNKTKIRARRLAKSISDIMPIW